MDIATEVDSALDCITLGGIIPVFIASEIDTAFTLIPERTHILGLPSEIDTAFDVRPSDKIQVGLATEIDSAFRVSVFGGRVFLLRRPLVTTIIDVNHVIVGQCPVNTAPLVRQNPD